MASLRCYFNHGKRGRMMEMSNAKHMETTTEAATLKISTTAGPARTLWKWAE
jgi:hypothetical protein